MSLLQNSIATGGELSKLLSALTSLRQGRTGARLPTDWEGVAGKVADAFNEVVEQNERMAEELARLRRVVGKEGKLSQRLSSGNLVGFWRDSITSVNDLIDDLVHPTIETARVIGAVAQGDLSKTMSLHVDERPLEGEFLRTARTINTMVDQLSSFAGDVTRVVREVGTEGKLGGQAKVTGVAGTWKDLTDSVNGMAGNLTAQVRNVAEVTTAVAAGDLSRKITVDVKGEFLELKNTINTMVDQLRSFASEVTRVAREVGTEGKLGGQARVEGVSGTWKDLTDSVNGMAGNLTTQVRNIAAVTTAVANGDLSRKITVDVKGEILELKITVNTMVDQLSSFASEVTRVAREVGTEGRLGGQADVRGVAGVWKDLTDSVNSMASNLTVQLRDVSKVATAIATGDLTQKITVDVRGEILQIKDVINTMVDQLRSFGSEVTRVAREVGTEGQLGGQADVIGVAGTWKDLTDSVNFMAGNLTGQVRNIAEVTKAVAAGDLSRKVTVDVKGEILELKNTVNTMVDQLRSFASEVTRVAREVGTEGKLGGQARVGGVSGTWKDLTDSVNGMAANLTAQVRGIAKVVTAVANGDLKQKLRVQAEGEIAELAETINEMIDTLATFADQVTTVAREVGVEGQLGGQAKVPGAAGIWKALTENVNQLAANLTNQVRAIADVATAVTEGDLTRSITVEAQGEVAALSSTINEMIRKLRDTTLKNTEQDWLKTNLAKFSRLLQGQRDLTNVGRMVLSELCPVVSAQQAEFYVLDDNRDSPRLTLLAGYASDEVEGVIKQVGLGQGLVGQCALDKQKILLEQIPPDYIRIVSGLGSTLPRTILVLPLIFEGQVRGVLELASLGGFNPTHQALLEQLTESIGIVLNTIEANMRTEDLLKQSTALAHELQTRQEELEKTNEELQEKSQSLAQRNKEVERKNQEVEQARQALEEKAEQLALTSRYKSEFLANMSHELRTPLNSLLILSDQLCKNSDGNLRPKQLDFAKTIHSSGNELLLLINDILDLSKIESGTANVEAGELRLNDLQGYIERTFRHVAESKNLGFRTRFDPLLPTKMFTDIKRLQQIIKNLLSNAFKFTHHGEVMFDVKSVVGGWGPDQEDLNRAHQVIAFSVSDTGIGIPSEKQQLIFEAFQQADGSTSRKYGGTGLGLAISRELARLLGGEIRLSSTPTRGSTFVLYLPSEYIPRPRRKAALAPQQAPATTHLLTPPGPVEERNLTSSGGSLADAVHFNEYADDRNDIRSGDQVLLIVENDVGFGRFLLDATRDKSIKGILTSLGAAGLVLSREFNPSAILLDIHLPDMNGWKVLELLKYNPATRHIPVVVVSTDDARNRALGSGAFAFLAKPIPCRDVIDGLIDAVFHYVNRPRRRLLVVGSNPVLNDELVRLLEGTGVEITSVPDGISAVRAMFDGPTDCVVVPEIQVESIAEALQGIEPSPEPVQMPIPIVVQGGVTPAVNTRIGRWPALDRMCNVRRASTVDAMLELIHSSIHLPRAKLLTSRRGRWSSLDTIEQPLAGRKILIVDDDMRNIFALASILEEHDAAVVSADNGRDAIRVLQADPEIEIVLMDIMMPEMDGMETMREIRKLPEHQKLPIVAVTAKAMKGDRERCIEAGAWDYLSKPVDADQLLAVLLLWLNR